MINRIKFEILTFANFLHQKIFNRPMGEEMNSFIKSLSWSLLGGFTAALIMFIVNIIAGRILGPKNYGEYNQIFSYATIISLIFLSGFDVSSVRYLSVSKNKKEQKELITTTLASFFAISIVIILLLKSLDFFNIKIIPSFENIVILLGLLIALKLILNGFLRSFNLIKKQSLYKLTDAFLVIGILLYFLFKFSTFNLTDFLITIVIGGIVFVIFSLKEIKRKFGKFNPKLLKKMFLKYNVFLIINYLVSMIFSMNKIIIGKYIGLQELGIFSAYLIASTSIVYEISGIFQNVFWPVAIKNYSRIREIIFHLDKIFLFFAPIWISIIFLITFTVISLFGKNYPIHLEYLLIFSINSFFGFIYTLYFSLININFIKISIIINSLYTILPIITLLVTKNIIIYLLTQILIFIILIGFMKKKLLYLEIQ